MWRGKLGCLESKSSLLASTSPFFSFMTKLWNGSVVASWVGTANGFILLPFHHLKSFQAYRENASIFHPFKRQQSWRGGKEYNKNNIPESVHGMRQHKLYRINRWQSTQAAQRTPRYIDHANTFLHTTKLACCGWENGGTGMPKPYKTK